jgi:cation transporter-like permease
MKKFIASLIFGIFMPIVMFGIIFFVSKAINGSSADVLPISFYIIAYVICAPLFTWLKYYELTKKEKKRAEEENE